MIRISKVSGVEDVNIALMDDLHNNLSTLLAGLEKKLSQFSA